MSTIEKLRAVIAHTLNIPADSVSPDLAIGDIEQWDSMGNMAIVAAVESEFGVEFPLEDLFELNSVRSIAAEIEKLS